MMYCLAAKHSDRLKSKGRLHFESVIYLLFIACIYYLNTDANHAVPDNGLYYSVRRMKYDRLSQQQLSFLFLTHVFDPREIVKRNSAYSIRCVLRVC